MKRFWGLVPLWFGILIGLLILAPPAWGSPPMQGTVTPRPTVAPPGTSTPLPTVAPPTATPEGTPGATPPGVPIDSQIVLALVVDKTTARPGDPLTYKAQVANTAGQEATNVWLTVYLPAEIEIQEVTTTLGEIHRYDREIAVEMGRLQPAFDSQFVTIAALIGADVAPGTVLIGRANLTSDQAGGGEGSVETAIEGEVEPTATPTTATSGNDGSSLPITGGIVPLAAAAAFTVLAIAGALLTWRKQGIR